MLECLVLSCWRSLSEWCHLRAESQIPERRGDGINFPRKLPIHLSLLIQPKNYHSLAEELSSTDKADQRHSSRREQNLCQPMNRLKFERKFNPRRSQIPSRCELFLLLRCRLRHSQRQNLPQHVTHSVGMAKSVRRLKAIAKQKQKLLPSPWSRRRKVLSPIARATIVD